MRKAIEATLLPTRDPCAFEFHSRSGAGLRIFNLAAAAAEEVRRKAAEEADDEKQRNLAQRRLWVVR